MAHVLELDHEKLGRVLQAAAFAWKHRLFGLRGMAPPEESFHPEGCQSGSWEHGVYLFASAAASRAGDKADTVIGTTKERFHKHFWTINPRHETPECWESSDFHQLVGTWIPQGLHDPVRIDGWRDNLRLLREEFDGDPCQVLLRHVPKGRSRQEVLAARTGMIKELCRFYGLEHKIAQLFILWAQTVSWPEDKAAWGLVRLIPALPVDIWFMKIVCMVDGIESFTTDDRNVVSGMIADQLCELCLDEGINWIDAAQGLWHIMAKLHAGRPKASLEQQHQHCLHECPFHTICVKLVPSPEKKPDGNVVRSGHMLWDRAYPRVLDPHVLLPQNIFFQGPEYDQFYALLKGMPSPSVVTVAELKKLGSKPKARSGVSAKRRPHSKEQIRLL